MNHKMKEDTLQYISQIKVSYKLKKKEIRKESKASKKLSQDINLCKRKQ